MNISVDDYGHAVVFNLKGELTEDSLHVLKRAVDHRLEDEKVVDLVLDLHEVPFLDSTVLEYMLDLQDRLAERLGQVKLARCDENVRKILEVTRLEGTFETFDELSQAVQVTGG